MIVIVFILWFLSTRSRDASHARNFWYPCIGMSFSPSSLFWTKLFWTLLLAVFLRGISLAAVVVTSRSMVSKHISSENQATGQEIPSTTTGTCDTVRPLIGSSLLTHKKYLATILTGSQILGLALVILD